MTKKDSEQNALWLLWEFVSIIKPKFIRIAEQHGLTLQQLHVLIVLKAADSTPMSKLAASLACDASNITGLVDRLSILGFVERCECERDRRIKMIALTEKGKSIQQNIKNDFIESCRWVIDDALDAQETDQFVAILNKLLVTHAAE